MSGILEGEIYWKSQIYQTINLMIFQIRKKNDKFTPPPPKFKIAPDKLPSQ